MSDAHGISINCRSLTMDTYGHLLPGQDVESADRLGAMVSGRDD